MDQRLLQTLVAFTVLLAAVGLLCLILAPFLPALGWAAVAAIATHPLHQRLAARLGGAGTRAAAVSTLIVFAMLVIPGALLILLLARDAFAARSLFESGDVTALINGIADHPAVGPWLERLESLTQRADIDLRATALQAGRTLLDAVLGTSRSLIANMFQFLFNGVLMLLALFFLYRDGAALDLLFWRLLPVPTRTREATRAKVGNVVSAVVVGVLVTAATQAMLGGLGFWVAGLPSPVLFGSLYFVAALIPVVGVSLVWIPAGLYLLLAGDSWTVAILFLAWNVVVVGGIDNVLRPLLISGRTGLPMSLMMIGALGGLLGFGLIGLVLGPLVIAMIGLAVELRLEAAASGES